MPYLGINTKQYLSKNEKFGEILIFLDGSTWQINFIDKVKTTLWLPADEIKVTQKGMQYFLTHIKKNETVTAIFIEK